MNKSIIQLNPTIGNILMQKVPGTNRNIETYLQTSARIAVMQATRYNNTSKMYEKSKKEYPGAYRCGPYHTR